MVVFLLIVGYLWSAIFRLSASILQEPIFIAFDFCKVHYDALEPMDGDESDADVPMDI